MCSSLRFYPFERSDIWNCITEQVIVRTANTIVANPETGLLYLLNEKKLKYIQILYDFLDKVQFLVIKINHPLENLTAHFLDYIQKSIEVIKNKSTEDQDQPEGGQNQSTEIEEYIEYKQEVANICNECFKKNKAIINSSRLEMQRALAKVNEFPKKLANYVDNFMLKNGKNIDNEDVLQQINEIFDIISLTTERDKFLYYYEQALSKVS